MVPVMLEEALCSPAGSNGSPARERAGCFRLVSMNVLLIAEVGAALAEMEQRS
jgi:hypothetical protein